MSRLDRIKEWEELATAANFKVSRLAKLCRCSPRQLERYFEVRFKKSPHEWLHAARMRRAVQLLRDGTPVKRTAYMLGYKEPTSFGHDFKRCFGLAPRKFCMTGGKINAPKNVAF